LIGKESDLLKDKNDDYNDKQELNSNESEAKEADYCKLPEMNKYIGHDGVLKEKQCNIQDWGLLINSTWYFVDKIKPRLSDINCVYREISKKDDIKYNFNAWKSLSDKQFIPEEVFEVKCQKSLIHVSYLKYQSLFVQLKNKYKQSIKVDKKNDDVN